MQSVGQQFAASDVSYRADDSAAELRLDLAKAYPPEARLAFWNRTLRLDRKRNAVEVVDDYRLTQAIKIITLTLMTPCAAYVSTPGELTLPMWSGAPVRVAYDGRAFHAKMEEVPIEDERLHHSWGQRLTRILLQAAAPPRRAKWTLRITQ